MRTMKIWRIAFAMLAAISLASCSSDDNVERRLTTNQKERYAQNISGEYSGESELKNGRVTGGTITLPPVPQTLSTSAFEGGDGRKGG